MTDTFADSLASTAPVDAPPMEPATKPVSIVAISLLVLAAACRSESSLQALAGVTMKQELSGWTIVSAPDGAYSFAMPGRPEALSSTRDGHFYRLRMESNSRGFEVVVQPAPIGALVPSALERMEAQLLRRWTAELEKTETRRGPYGEVRAFNSRFTLSEHSAEARIQVVGGRMFVMTAIYLPEGFATLHAEAEHFFRSLVVADPVLEVRMHHDYVEAHDRALYASGSCREQKRSSPSAEIVERVVEAASSSGGREARISSDPSTPPEMLESAAKKLRELGYEVQVVPSELPERPCPAMLQLPPSGSLDKNKIREVIRERLRAVKYCYESELARHPDARGVVTAQFAIAPSGQVADAEIMVSTIGVAAVSDCVLEEMRKLKFPEPHGGHHVSVVYPFVFKTRGSTTDR